MRREAERYWPSGATPALGPVMLEVTYLYEGTAADVDNIVKPIQDALEGLVYVDDSQVTDLVGRKRDLDSNLRVESLSAILAEGFDRGNEFLHVVVREAPDQEAI